MNNTQLQSSVDTIDPDLGSHSTNQARPPQAAQYASDRGICSTNPVIEGYESLEDWIAHRETVVRELCPVGALETAYAERTALYLWRIHRVIRFEIIASLGENEPGSMRPHEESPGDRERIIPLESPTAQTIIKYEAHLDRCLVRTMTELRRLQKERRHGLRDVGPSGRGADRAGVCIPGGRGADRAGNCQNAELKAGSHGGSPSQSGSHPRNSSASMNNSRTRKKATSGKHPASQRASPIPKTPPLLDAISKRNRWIDANADGSFVRHLSSSKLDITMIPEPLTLA